VVARQGVEALFAGKDHVIGGDLKTRWSAIKNKFLPEQVKARRFAKVSRPRLTAAYAFPGEPTTTSADNSAATRAVPHIERGRAAVRPSRRAAEPVEQTPRQTSGRPAPR
jgi:hypothetical protein